MELLPVQLVCCHELTQMQWCVCSRGLLVGTHQRDAHHCSCTEGTGQVCAVVAQAAQSCTLSHGLSLLWSIARYAAMHNH